jgi:hypothetical protein
LKRYRGRADEWPYSPFHRNVRTRCGRGVAARMA